MARSVELKPKIRLQSFYDDEVMAVVHHYFEQKVLEKTTLLFFLSNHKHKLFHMYISNLPCCECDKEQLNVYLLKNTDKLKIDEFNLLFKSVPGQQKHEVKGRGRITKHCLCMHDPKNEKELEVTDLDICLICKLIKFVMIYGYQSLPGNPNWFEQIKTVRNYLCHIGSADSLTEAEAEQNWKILEDSVISVASTIGRAYQKFIQRQISKLKDKYSHEEELKRILVETNASLEEKITTALRNLEVHIDKVWLQVDKTEFIQNTRNEGSNADEQLPTQKEKCYVAWHFRNQGTWEVSRMQSKLENLATIGDFDIEFVYVGSLVIMTSALTSLLTEVSKFKATVEKFLAEFGTVIAEETLDAIHINVNIKIHEKNPLLNVQPKVQENMTQTPIEGLGKLFVVAIDIGSTFSGYALSSRSRPTSIYSCEWRRADLISSKTPTCLLLNLKKEFVAFGYAAEQKYLENILPDEKTDDYYYFRRFRMILQKEKFMDLDMVLEDETRKSMKAIDVFSIAINYLKEDAKKKLKSTLYNIDENDIQYVITVPAIWNDRVELFMRKAAEMVGIKSDQLMIVPEPQAAALSCEELRTDREGTFSLKEGNTFAIVNLGGAMGDITFYQSEAGGLAKILYHSDGHWDGTTVVDEYLTFLKDLFGEKVISELKHDDLEDYTDLLYSFEEKMVKVRSDGEKDIVISLPYELIDITKKLKGSVAKSIDASKYKGEVTYANHKISISPRVFRSLLEPTLCKFMTHLEELLKKKELSGLDYIGMVGGFSECELIQKAVKDAFGTGKRSVVIIPDKAGLAVLKGAVLFGHKPPKINPRVSQKTYGVQSLADKDIFLKLSTKGERLELGLRRSCTVNVLPTDNKTLELSLYTSEDIDPRYITDPSCQLLGRLVLPPIRHGEKLEIEASVTFGDSELLFIGKNLKTGEQYEDIFELVLTKNM